MDGQRDDPTTHLLELLGGKWVCQAVSTAAALGIADALETPATTLQLAERLGCHAPSLKRLLRALGGEGLLALDLEDRWSLTARGEPLRSGELRDLAIFVGSHSQWTPWAALEHSVRTGGAAFEHTHGQALFDYLADRPDEAALYDTAVDAFTRSAARALAEGDELDGVETVVDVGGGRGTLLLELLVRFPSMRGVLFDQPHVAEAASERIRSAGLQERCEAVAGDFFEAVPPGADAYVVKHVIHNWDDDQATRILSRCAEAMAPGGRVLVVEGVVLPGNQRDAVSLMDLEMLVLCGSGRERTKPELRALFAAAGLKLTHSRPLSNATRVLSLVPRNSWPIGNSRLN